MQKRKLATARSRPLIQTSTSFILQANRQKSKRSQSNKCFQLVAVLFPRTVHTKGASTVRGTSPQNLSYELKSWDQSQEPNFCPCDYIFFLTKMDGLHERDLFLLTSRLKRTLKGSDKIFYYPTVLVIVQKARETSTNILRYLTWFYSTTAHD